MNYLANTNSGWVDIGTFPNDGAAYSWAAQRYGNDFLGIYQGTLDASGNPAGNVYGPPLSLATFPTGSVFSSGWGVVIIIGVAAYFLLRNRL